MTWLKDVSMLKSKLSVSRDARKLFRDKSRALPEYLARIENPRHQVSRITRADRATLLYLNMWADGRGRIDLAGKRLDLGRVSRVADLGWLALRNGKPTLTERARAVLLPPSNETIINETKARQGEAAAFREIEVRRGQRQFRDGLRRVFGDKCVISDCRAVDVLEAAHVVPYAKKQPDRDLLANGLLLRADIHTLFDLHLISIEPRTNSVHLAPSIRNLKPYKGLHGKSVDVKTAGLSQLQYHFSQFDMKSRGL